MYNNKTNIKLFYIYYVKLKYEYIKWTEKLKYVISDSHDSSKQNSKLTNRNLNAEIYLNVDGLR